MNLGTTERRAYDAPASYVGLMGTRLPQSAGPGLMAVPWRSGHGLMEPDPELPPFDWRRDGVAFLWLIALILALVVWIGLLAQDPGQPHTAATASVAATN